MEHHLNIIASNFGLNKKELTDFALLPENKRKFGIVDNNGFVTTTTSFTESLVKSFREHKANVELKEHDMVALNESGAKGAVVYVYEGRGMYEVEFPRAGQHPLIMTLSKNEIQKILI